MPQTAKVAVVNHHPQSPTMSKTECNAKEQAPFNFPHKKTIYIVRHAEAMHNVKERLAIEKAKAKGDVSASNLERARKSSLEMADDNLFDPPLSDLGKLQANKSAAALKQLLAENGGKYCPPEVVLVSPLRRALQTAITVFVTVNDNSDSNSKHKKFFVATEFLRERRTGLICDEHGPIQKLRNDFPQVDFDSLCLKQCEDAVAKKGENHAAVRKRAGAFFDFDIMSRKEKTLAIVSHKGWIRELQKELQQRVEKDPSRLKLVFDLDNEDRTIFGNAEIRVVDVEWKNAGEMTAFRSHSLRHAMVAED